MRLRRNGKREAHAGTQTFRGGTRRKRAATSRLEGMLTPINLSRASLNQTQPPKNSTHLKGACACRYESNWPRALVTETMTKPPAQTGGWFQGLGFEGWLGLRVCSMLGSRPRMDAQGRVARHAHQTPPPGSSQRCVLRREQRPHRWTGR
eukprot:366402-Chlamydomonas_euryale.AAC.17